MVSGVMPSAPVQTWYVLGIGKSRLVLALLIAIEAHGVFGPLRRIVQMAGAMPGAIALTHRYVAHLNRQKYLQGRPPGLIVNLPVDTDRPRCQPPKLQHVHPRVHHLTKAQEAVFIVEKFSPGFGVRSLDELLVAMGRHLEEAHLSPKILARV